NSGAGTVNFSKVGSAAFASPLAVGKSKPDLRTPMKARSCFASTEHKSTGRVPFFVFQIGLRRPSTCMAGTSLLSLIDDIATVLDDVAILTKVAAKKTAGVLGDDLALNAQQVAGVKADRELPVVWAVAKGSLLNKVILVPAALAISALAPWAVL